jgi:hypothetical protein
MRACVRSSGLARIEEDLGQAQSIMKIMDYEGRKEWRFRAKYGEELGWLGFVLV